MRGGVRCCCGRSCVFWLAGANLLVVVRGAAMEARTMQVRWNVPGSGGVRWLRKLLPSLCARKKNSLVARAFAGAVVKMVVAPLCERRWLTMEEDGVAMMVALRRR